MKQSFHHFFSTGSENTLCPPALGLHILLAEGVLSRAECRSLARELCRSEERLLKEHKRIPIAGLSDGLTTRWLGYNVLSWDLPEIQTLRKQMKILYLSYLKKANIRRWPNEIQCWGNILRDGDSFKPHLHNFLPRPVLTAALSLTVAPTQTIYTFPFPLSDGKNYVSQFHVETKPGTIAFVPGWVSHFTTPHQGRQKRVTLGIDIASGLKNGARVPFDDGKRFRL